MSHWTFDIGLGGSVRTDGVFFECILNRSLWDDAFWVWKAHRPDGATLILSPVDTGLQTPADVEVYLNTYWPLPKKQESL